MDKNTALSHLLLHQKSKGVFEKTADSTIVVDAAYVDNKISHAQARLKEIYDQPVVLSKDFYFWRRELESWQLVRHEIELSKQ